MNYEEKYNEILEWARKNKARLNGVPIEEVLPELRESEDERIRKELKEAFEAYDIESTWNGIPIRSIFAWLEKQKEQIPYTDFVIKPHKGDDNNPYDMQVSEAQEYAIKRGFGIPYNDGEVYIDERHMTQTVGNILRWADEHPKEQKPAEWSEEDKQWLSEVYFAIDHSMYSDDERRAMKKYIDSLRSQSKTAEWNEEDETRLTNTLIMLKEYAIHHYSKDDVEKSVDWLEKRVKSIRPSWKPSEEHLSALLAVFNDPNNIGSQTCQLALTDLYEQLKKL